VKTAEYHVPAKGCARVAEDVVVAVAVAVTIAAAVAFADDVVEVLVDGIVDVNVEVVDVGVNTDGVIDGDIIDGDDDDGTVGVVDFGDANVDVVVSIVRIGLVPASMLTFAVDVWVLMACFRNDKLWTPVVTNSLPPGRPTSLSP